MGDLPSLYALSSELVRVMNNDDLSPEEVEAEIDRLYPALTTKAANVSRMIQYHEDLAKTIKEREAQVAEVRKATERKADRLRAYLLRCMELAEASEIVDEKTGTTIKVRNNPPSVAIEDESAIPAEFLIEPPPPAPRPDKKAIAAALKVGQPVPGCHLQHTRRLEVK